MPEQSEVLTIVDGLDFYLCRKIIKSAEFLSGKYEDNPPDGFNEFVKSLPITIEKVFCKGKLPVFNMKEIDGDDKWWLLNSLRMTGTWQLEQGNKEHTRFKFTFEPKEENGVFDIDEIFYIDPRGLGTFEFINDEDTKEKKLNALAPCFIGPKEYRIDYKTFYDNIKTSKKSLLTSKLQDQKSICSGIGNYLLSEIMYECGFHPTIKCNELTDDDIQSLFDNSKKIITSSYNHGGMSMRDYVNIYGEEGKYEKELKVYGKKGKTDPYGNKVLSLKRGNGQTLWYVPGLQQKKEVTPKKEKNKKKVEKEIEISFDEEDD